MRGYDEVIAICPSVCLSLPPIIYLSAHTSTQPASEPCLYSSLSVSFIVSLAPLFISPSLYQCLHDAVARISSTATSFALVHSKHARALSRITGGLLPGSEESCTKNCRMCGQRSSSSVSMSDSTDNFPHHSFHHPTTPPPHHPVPRASLTNVCSRKERIDRGIFKKMMRNQRRLGLLSILDSSVGL